MAEPAVGRARALLAVGDEAMRAVIRGTLELDVRFEVCAETADAPTTVAVAACERPDLCLLAVALPRGGIEAAREIRSVLPETAIVMLASRGDAEEFFAAVRAGASGYLTEDTSLERLPHALADVLDGSVAIPRPLVAQLIAEFRDEGPRRREVISDGPPLSSREWQVLELLGRGRSTAEIAKRLFISKATVRSHVCQLRHKLGVPDRQSAVRALSDLAKSAAAKSSNHNRQDCLAPQRSCQLDVQIASAPSPRILTGLALRHSTGVQGTAGAAHPCGPPPPW